MVSRADDEVFDRALNQGDIEKSVVSKNWLYTVDSNSGNYNGQIVFDSTSLSHSNKYLNYAEAYMEIPFVMSIQDSADASAAGVMNAYTLGLKNGYYQLIDSVQVEYGTKNVIQSQNFLNFHTNFGLLTSMSQDNLKKDGSVIGFAPDSAGSYRYSNNVSKYGNGFINNAEDILAADKFAVPEINSGFLQRRREQTAIYEGGYSGITTLSTKDKLSNLGHNFFQTEGAGVSMIKSWVITAHIRLKDLSDFFSKITLVKNGSLRITVNYNSCISKILVGDAGVVSIDSYTQLSGHTNPMLFGDSKTTSVCSNFGLAAVAGTITSQCNVSTSGLGTAKSKLTSCRLYIPAYELSPTAEMRLLNKNPITSFSYNDLYSYNFSVASGESFNQILSNGIVNPKYLVVIPFVRGTAGTTVFSANAIDVWKSIFDTAPATTSPCVALNDFQVQISGNNIWNTAIRFDYEMFIHEVSAINAALGGLETGMTSGLISEYMWSNAYRYYVANLSRRADSDDSVPKAVQIMGTNNTGYALDLVAFVAYKRDFSINTATGIEV